MKKSFKPLVLLILIPVIVITLLLSPTFKSDAATLSAAYVMLSRMQAGLSSGIEIYIGLETSQTIPTGGTLTLEFPLTDDTEWCRTAGTLTATGVTSTPADSSGDYDINTALPGTLSASCAQGDGTTDPDTITITGLTELTVAGGTYGVKIVGNTGALGTSVSTSSRLVTLTVRNGTTVDTKTFGINLVADDQVDITATVVDVPTVTCSISTNSVGLGNLYIGGTYVTATHTISTTTSTSASGYFWSVYGQGNGSTDAGLWKSSATTHLIPSNNASTTVDISTTNSEGFGMNTTVPTGATSGSGFSGNGAGVFGSVGLGASEAELLLSHIGPETSGDTATITYGARAGTGAVAGSYAETITFTCGGYY
jgi:hypothetical protein